MNRQRKQRPWVIALCLATMVLLTGGPAVAQDCTATGDLNGSGSVDIADLTYFINWTEIGGPPPVDLFEADLNGDCAVDSLDLVLLYQCYNDPNPGQCGSIPTCCDPENRVHDPNDADTDGIPDDQDNCPNVYNPSQDGTDTDQDGVPDLCDNCPATPNPGQEDATSDGIGDACCCTGMIGNVDYDPQDIIDVGDLTFLITFLFLDGPQPACPEEANLDQQGGVDVGDLTLLINYLFIGDFLPECS